MSSLYTRLKITLGKADADSQALAALTTDDQVQVRAGNPLSFLPSGDVRAATGVIFYPGGRCDPRAYAPVARTLAAAGYPCFVPHMPFRLAVLAADRASQIIAAHPHIERWFIGGHSMGGAIAGAYVYKNPRAAAGLFFVGAYPSGLYPLTERQLPVTLVHGTRDFVLRAEELAEAGNRLPPETHFVAIEGGDHYQFGCFANADVTATISRETQQRQMCDALLTNLGEIAGTPGDATN